MSQHEVVSPVGREAVAPSPAARRLDDLNGKTVGEFWNGVFKGDVSFPVIRRLLQARFPRLKIVTYTEFPHAPASDHPSKQRELALQMVALARSQGCDAIISGNGA